MKNVEIGREMALIEEVQRGFQCVRRGLHEVDRIMPGNNFYDPPIMFLAMGFERILKCTICMHFKHTHGVYPTIKDNPWKFGKGHDLIGLKARITPFVVPFEGTSREQDYFILTKHPQVNRLLEILSVYGMKGRYHDLDAVLLNEKSEDATRSLDHLQRDLGVSVYGQSFLSELANIKTQPTAYYKMNNQLKALVELFTRAIARQFIFGSFQSESRRFIADLSPFYELDDDELGNTKYL